MSKATREAFVRSLLTLTEQQMDEQYDALCDIGGMTDRGELAAQSALVAALEAVAELRFPGWKSRYYARGEQAA